MLHARAKTSRIGIAALIGMASLGLAACSANGASRDDPLVLAVLTPQTGPAALAAKEINNGVKLAVKDINDDGGVHGRDIKLVDYDTKLEPAQTVSVYTRAVSQDHAIGVIGPYSTVEVTAIVDASARLKTPFISPTVSTTSITEGDDAGYVFRSGVVNKDVTATNLATAKKVGCTKPALITDDGGYGEDYKTGITDQLAPKQFVDVETVPVAATDVNAQVNAVKAAGADCVFIGASAGATVGLVIKQMVSTGFKPSVFAPDSLVTEDARHVAGNALEQLPGAYSVQALDDTKSAYTNLREEYVAEYGQPVSPYWVSAYDATHLLALALEKSGGQGGEALVDALESLRGSDYAQVYGADGAKGGFGDGDHNWLSTGYLTASKVTSGKVEPVAGLD